MFAATLSLFAQQGVDQFQELLDTLVKYLVPIAVVGALLGLFYTVCWWIIFSKAGYPGWAVLIPIYSNIVLLWVGGKPWWHLIMWCIPIVHLFFIFPWIAGLSRNFGGKGGIGFILAFLFFGWLVIPILAFGSAEYVGERGNA
jgi:hypothetical protein